MTSWLTKICFAPFRHRKIFFESFWQETWTHSSLFLRWGCYGKWKASSHHDTLHFLCPWSWRRKTRRLWCTYLGFAWRYSVPVQRATLKIHTLSNLCTLPFFCAMLKTEQRRYHWRDLCFCEKEWSNREWIYHHKKRNCTSLFEWRWLKSRFWYAQSRAARYNKKAYVVGAMNSMR